MSNEPEREVVFQRNGHLEGLLKEINGLLGPLEATEILPRFRVPEYPVVFVIGAPRSGTTLTMQWLASSGAFGYPTNLIARFYRAPYLGAKIQRLLLDPTFDFNNEFYDLAAPVEFSSNLGKTRGVLSPNEFWYFWRRFIPNVEPRPLSLDEERQVDTAGFAAALAALEHALEKPLAMKGMILQYNLRLLASTLHNRVLFVFIKRHPLYNVQSLLEARVKYYGTEDAWYSVKPPEYDELRELTPIEQVAGQIYYTNASIQNEMQQLSPEHCLELSYETFCQTPIEAFAQVREKLSQQVSTPNCVYKGPQSFEVANQLRLSDAEVKAVQAAWARFSGEALVLNEVEISRLV